MSQEPAQDRTESDEQHESVRTGLPEHLDALRAERDEAKADRDRLAQAMWDARGALGFDNDGDRSPGAAIAGMGYQWFAESHVKEAKEQARDYEELLDLWDGNERREWVARAEAAEAETAALQARIEAAIEGKCRYPDEHTDCTSARVRAALAGAPAVTPTETQAEGGIPEATWHAWHGDAAPVADPTTGETR